MSDPKRDEPSAEARGTVRAILRGNWLDGSSVTHDELMRLEDRLARALDSARREALEEAAKLCEREEAEHDRLADYMEREGQKDCTLGESCAAIAAKDCAFAIRALRKRGGTERTAPERGGANG